MISKKALTFVPLALLLLLGTAGCAPGGNAGSPGQNGGTSQDGGSAQSGTLDDEGFVVPGKPVTLKIGEPVDYFSFAGLTDEEAQRVTILSYKYIDKEDLPSDAPISDMNNGALVLSISWHALRGNVQSNDGYFLISLDSGEEGYNRWFGSNQLDNGGVDDGETRTGELMWEIPRGKTTVTLTDYTDKPVAILYLDTSK